MAPQKSEKTPAREQLPPLGQSTQSVLAVEAHHLRVVLREIAQHFLTNLESEIVRAIEMAGDVPENDRKDKHLDALITDLRGLQVKPHKGRLRDLKRIRNLVRDMTTRLEDIL